MSNMVIGIDGNEANVQNSVGTSVYTYELLRHFKSQATSECRFITYLREKPAPHLPRADEYFTYKVVPGKRLWRDIFFPLYLLFHKEVDVLFCPAHYIPRFCPVTTVVAIHDVAYEYFPDEFLKKDLYKLRTWTEHGLKHSKAVIAVSENTRRDIIKFYQLPEEKIHVVYNGFKTFDAVTHHAKSADVLEKYGLTNKKYFLYVGTLQPRKNISVLIKAFAQLHKDNADLRLVLAGRKGWLYNSIFKTVQDLQLKDAVVFPGYVPDQEIAHLYQHAQAYVLPSLYEGFGIPVLEAMHQGCPVITSNASSLPEIGGDACLYFAPTNQKELENHMVQLLRDSKLRETLIFKGKQQAKKFSLEKMAHDTLQILIDAAS